MESRHLRRWIGGLFPVMFVGLVLAVPAHAQEKPNLEGIPKSVIDALQTKFPKAEILKWTKEREGDFVIYDFEFEQEGRKLEADIKEDGTIHNWEREIAAADLPDAVRKAVEDKYPNHTALEVMAITAVTDGKDALEGFEIVLRTAAGKEIEVTVAPDGKILEDSSDEG